MEAMCAKHAFYLVLVLFHTFLYFQFGNADKLMIILLDGFRWDYFQPQFTGFQRFISSGVKAEYMTPIFPSSSYPNYYSIMTGLYAEDHGMVSNDMYDREKDEYFLIGTNPEQNHSHWWNGGDPLWITMQRQNKRSYMFYWPGCEVEIRGLRPNYCDPYAGAPTMLDFRSAINRSLDLMQSGEADLTAVYFELTDKYGHRHGPLSPELLQVIHKVDNEISLLLGSWNQRIMADGSGKMADSVNIIIVSDHGMQLVKADHHIDIKPAILNATHDGTYLRANLSSGPTLQLWPLDDNKTMEVYHSLKDVHPHVTVYLKNELPERWHLKRNRIVPDITLVADLGWAYKCPEPCNKTKGDHGYDNNADTMRGIFLAIGPGFKQGYQSPGFMCIELYQLMCHLLGIHPSPHNGTWLKVEKMLAVSQSSLLLPNTVFCFFHILLVLCFVTYGAR